MPSALRAPSLPAMPTLPRHPALAAFLDRRCIRRGRFTLASGATASYYCDGKLASFDPEGIHLIVEAILKEIAHLRPPPDAIGGMDMGATPIAAALALRLHQLGKPLPTFVVRKDVKAHGTMKKIEGPIPAQPGNVVIVEDVVTTAGSVVQAIEAVRAVGHKVLLAISLLDRDAGGAARLRELGVPYQPLVTIAELGLSNTPL